MESQYDLLEVLNYIEPSGLDYQGWINIGMALQYEGYGIETWDAFSRRDPGRYHPGECERKWNSFRGDSHTLVTGGTIVQMAREQGWMPPYDPGHALDWNDTITIDKAVIDSNWVEGKEIEPPKDWSPVKDLITYLEILFDSTDNVGYVTKSFEKD